MLLTKQNLNYFFSMFCSITGCNLYIPPNYDVSHTCRQWQNQELGQWGHCLDTLQPKKNCDKQLKNWAKNNKNAKKNIKKETRLLKHYTGGMDQGQMQKSRECKGKNGSDFS